VRHRVKRIRWPALAVAGVLVAGSGTAYAVTSEEPAGDYRTVAATKGDVEQVLTTSGTVDAARRADLEFATSGTVAAVKVAVGDTVTAGQVIARLDTASLGAALTKARASLAQAVAQLSADQDAQSDAVADAADAADDGDSSGTDKPSGNTPSVSPSDGADPETAALLAELRKQQEAVTDAQSAASAAITAAKGALATQTDACAAAYQDPAGGDADDADAADADAAADDACAAALAEVQARQDEVSDAQDSLAAALSTLAGTLTGALATLQSSDSPTGSSDTPTSNADAPTSDGSSTPSADGSTAGTVSAARLAADQAAIERARAELVDARQALRQAVLPSTRSGRVVALDVAEGDDVSAGAVVATVVGGRAVTIETTLSEAKIRQVEVGQHVRVTTPGESSAATGTVTAIGLVADSSSGTASYPVTVTVEDPTIALPTGSQAMLAIVVATAADVVTVPTSAVTRRGDGDDGVVRTWDGTTVTEEKVTIGTVGASRVEITDGLAAGDRVVLADLDQEISGASDSIDDRGGFGNAPAFRMDRVGPGGGPPVTFKSGG
jgi:HlyD family secretion protein